MGNYLYDSYEAKMKVTNDEINDWTFYTKLKENFVSPKKVFKFVEIIFITFKSPPYHLKFLQSFYNNLHLLERDEYFHILEELNEDLKALTFHESFNNYHNKLCEIKANTPDRSIFNNGLVKPKKKALEDFFLYINYHRNEFEKMKSQLKVIVNEIKKYPEYLESDKNLKKIEYEDNFKNEIVNVTEINNEKEGRKMIIKKKKSDNKILYAFYGEFKNDKINGLGLVKIEDAQIEGNFIENNLDGKVCCYNKDNIEYIEYKNGEKNGRYIKLLQNGNIYSSSFENDKEANKFSIYLKENNQFFTGNRNEYDTFNGIYYKTEEDFVAVGNFNKNFQMIGEGYYYSDNSGYYYTFDNGEIVPSLAYMNKSDGELYFGYCNQYGDMHGEKVLLLYYTNDEYKSDLFYGSYINGNREGYGEYYWGDGDYEKAFFPNGWGIRYAQSRDYFIEGILKKGFADGPGFLTYKGKKYGGIFDLQKVKDTDLFISNDGKAFRIYISHSGRNNAAEGQQFKVEQN